MEYVSSPIDPSPFPHFLLFVNCMASYVAVQSGRLLFQDDRPELLQSMEEYYASLRQDAAH